MLGSCVELDRLEMDQMRRERGHDAAGDVGKYAHLPCAQVRRILSFLLTRLLMNLVAGWRMTFTSSRKHRPGRGDSWEPGNGPTAAGRD